MMFGLSKKKAKMLSQLLILGSAMAIVLAFFGYLGWDLLLASTQWLLVAAVLALFGVYMRLEG